MTEGPYKLPEGWRWVQLGNVADVFSGAWGKDPSPQNSGEATLVRVVRVSDIKETLTIDYDNVPWRCVTQKDVKRLALRDGDIVVVKSSGSKAKVISGRAALFRQQPETFLPSNFVFAVRCNIDKVDPGFLWYWLNSSPVKQFVEQMVATFTYPNLKKSDYVKVPVPLPPLKEQKRVVARIEELMGRVREARRLREEAKKEVDRLWQAVLAQTFPRPGSELPEGWHWVRLGEVARVFSGSPAPQDKCYFEGGVFPFVRVQDLGRYGITTNLIETADKVNEKAVRELRLVPAKSGTILFPKSGAAILTNTRAILGEDAYIVSHLAGIEPRRDALENLWAFYWLCTVDMAQYIDNPAYPSLRLSKIRQILIPLPPLEEQKRIVAYLQEVQEKIKALKEAQAQTEVELKRLEQAILEKAFRGEL